MPNNKMLIDATHPEETRVVVLRDGRVEEFDYESAARKPLRGNIYLAKVTRVEPSLQAAFVEYGGNRHGFLAFNEIHPDYYQIPVADRLALIEEEAAAEAEEEAEADARAERRARGSRRERGEQDDRQHDDGGAGPEPAVGVEESDADGTIAAAPFTDEMAAVPDPRSLPAAGGLDEPRLSETSSGSDAAVAAAEPPAVEKPQTPAEPMDAPRPVGLVEDVGVHEVENGAANGEAGEAEVVEEVGASEDAMEEVPTRPRRRARSYKIQEVIKRRQVILVQVVKEERGNKGAALTTYLSLAGRYTVLMPNTARGGGISRKITQPQDRKRLKAIAAELDVPEGMGLIIRTAGAARTKQEIKRDFEYLLRLWENVREMTLQSTAPNLVYEEGDLIKRSIRDHYTKDVDEILVAGEAAFHEARDFMSMLMPSHAKNVVDYREPEPLFTRFQIERQLNAMFSPYVTLRSGGYLVVNQTEALVAIDVNSGKSTREFSIEETALNTNLEAADEIARQLKLRDLAGLIVIDFIDMEEKRNNRAVERRLKDALRFDRARIQVGRISHFGLLEMSRQRLRTGVLEGSTSQCPHCQGTGMIRSTESVALAVLRGLEDALMSGPRTSLIALTTAQVALYILNNKRGFIIDMERRSGVTITVQASDKMQGANFAIERGAAPAQPQRRPERAAVSMDWGFAGTSDNEPPEEAPEAAYQLEIDEIEEAGEGREESDGDRRGRSRRRRRRGRRGERGEGQPFRSEQASGDDQDRRPSLEPNGRDHDHGDEDGPSDEAGQSERFEDAETGPMAEANHGGGERSERGEDDRRGRRRRRGRRGGRRSGRERMPDEAILAADEGEIASGAEPGEMSLPATPALAPGGYAEGIAGQGAQPDVEIYAVLPDTDAGPAEPIRREHGNGAPSRDRRPSRMRHERDPEQAAPRPEIEASPAEQAAKPPAHAHLDERDRSGAVAAEAETAAKAIEVTQTASAAEAPQVTETAQQPSPRPRRSNGDPQAATPRIERVVVKPEESSATVIDPAATGETSTTPARKGWWQRKFGGG